MTTEIVAVKAHCVKIIWAVNLWRILVESCVCTRVCAACVALCVACPNLVHVQLATHDLSSRSSRTEVAHVP